MFPIHMKTRRFLTQAALSVAILHGCSGGCDGRGAARLALDLNEGLYGEGLGLVIAEGETVFQYAPSWIQHAAIRLKPESGSVVRPVNNFEIWLEVESPEGVPQVDVGAIELDLLLLDVDEKIPTCLDPCPEETTTGRYRFKLHFGSILDFALAVPDSPQLEWMTLKIPPGAVVLGSGATLEGEGVPEPLKFRYLLTVGRGEDTTPPRILDTSFYPSDSIRINPSAPMWVQFSESMGRASVYMEYDDGDEGAALQGVEIFNDAIQENVEGNIANVLQLRNRGFEIGETYKLTVIGRGPISPDLTFPRTADLAGNALVSSQLKLTGSLFDWACGFSFFFLRSMIMTPILAAFFPSPQCNDPLLAINDNATDKTWTMEVGPGRFAALGTDGEGDQALPYWWEVLPGDLRPTNIAAFDGAKADLGRGANEQVVNLATLMLQRGEDRWWPDAAPGCGRIVSAHRAIRSQQTWQPPIPHPLRKPGRIRRQGGESLQPQHLRYDRSGAARPGIRLRGASGCAR